MFRKVFSSFLAENRTDSQDADTLLKEATLTKKSGDLGGAVTLLRKAYKLIAQGSRTYQIETFLRLPLYLQASGERDAAWHEFSQLLVNGYPNQMKDNQIIPMEHSVIYDKMRLFLQREGKSIDAVPFGVCSYLSWAIGLHRQDRKDELQNLCLEGNLRRHISKLLERTGKEKKIENLVALVREELASVPHVALPKLIKKVQNILA